MVNPVPGYSVSTAYKKTGSLWATCGWHTGQDYSAPSGQAVVAARGGTCVHVNYGSSFGSHQFAIRPGDGTEDFYAHCSSRPSNGYNVGAGIQVATVGSEGNATGPHLHFERHKWYGWGCDVVDDPMKSHNDGGATSGPPSDECSPAYPTPSSNTVYLSKLRYGQKSSDSVWYLQNALNTHPLTHGQNLPLTGCYLGQTDEEVRLCQQQHGYGNDPVNASYVGTKQAQHLFYNSGVQLVYDI